MPISSGYFLEWTFTSVIGGISRAGDADRYFQNTERWADTGPCMHSECRHSCSFEFIENLNTRSAALPGSGTVPAGGLTRAAPGRRSATCPCLPAWRPRPRPSADSPPAGRLLERGRDQGQAGFSTHRRPAGDLPPLRQGNCHQRPDRERHHPADEPDAGAAGPWRAPVARIPDRMMKVLRQGLQASKRPSTEAPESQFLIDRFPC